MKSIGVDDLRKRIPPRTYMFHSVDTTGTYNGVTYWKQAVLYMV
jgi:hypothetical protein